MYCGRRSCLVLSHPVEWIECGSSPQALARIFCQLQPKTERRVKSTSATVVTSSPIRTKFYRPPLPRDLVERPRLIDQLDLGLDSPLTLVSAPAGYGKSTLVSTWLHSCERPSVWISLDETMDDLSAFLTYLVTAIQAVFPSALQLTQTLLTAISVPPLSALSAA